MRARIEKYKPVWEGLFENYTKSIIMKNRWRWERIGFEIADVLQEAWIVFDICQKKYIVTEAKHFMALFKTSLHNRLLDLQGYGRKQIKEVEFEERDYTDRVANEGELFYKLSQMKKEVEKAKSYTSRTEADEIFNNL